VTLGVEPTIAGQIEWAVALGHGTLIAMAGQQVNFTAAGMKEDVTITATLKEHHDKSLPVCFHVKTPETITFVVNPDCPQSGITYGSDRKQIDMWANLYFYFGPDDVNFYRVLPITLFSAIST
jgi:hypothetical protein